MDHAEERGEARDRQEQPGEHHSVVDDRRERPSPQGRGQDESVSEDEKRLIAERGFTREGGRELEDTDQERREDDELRDVVEGEAEEAVQVPRPDPARVGPSEAGRRPLPGRRSPRGPGS